MSVREASKRIPEICRLSVFVCYACKRCIILILFSCTLENERSNIFFFLWQSDGSCEYWNGIVVGWLFSCHILPLAVRGPLSQARGLIQSQRRGHWLLPGLREETLGIMWRGVGQGENVFFSLSAIKFEGLSSTVSLIMGARPMTILVQSTKSGIPCEMICIANWITLIY